MDVYEPAQISVLTLATEQAHLTRTIWKCILGATFECKKHTGSQFTDLRTGLKLTDRLFKVTCRDAVAEAKPTADKSIGQSFFFQTG